MRASFKFSTTDDCNQISEVHNYLMDEVSPKVFKYRNLNFFTSFDAAAPVKILNYLNNYVHFNFSVWLVVVALFLQY